MVAGVLGGIGEYYGVEPTMLRLIFGALLVFTAIVPMAIIYLFAAIIIPQE